MTVCIAAQCLLLDGARGFVLCADTETSGAGIDNAVDKLYRLGWNYMALLSGPWGIVVSLAARIRAEIEKREPTDDDDLLGRLQIVASDFAKSPALYPKGSQPCDVVITGFMASEPVMVLVSIYGAKATSCRMFERVEIGSGYPIARAMLSQRRYTSLASLEKALYLVYEAKRLSEWADGVGQMTQIMIHAPMSPGPTATVDHSCFAYLSEAALVHLETLRKEFFVQPIKKVEAFPHDFFRGDYPFKS